ncbi:hypothetical protein BDZ85DRAFT_262110 [Elsinoe ampelina]|uniref:Uncharacterized protein n=1 Tax=Elsinoe ampelina TaxID=302913 RepID=A0A6A6GDE1_9PEZI|nr:hypothetical protein BDZ85DRAFT_262110 [Elsinoe ampelina]
MSRWHDLDRRVHHVCATLTLPVSHCGGSWSRRPWSLAWGEAVGASSCSTRQRVVVMDAVVISSHGRGPIR